MGGSLFVGGPKTRIMSSILLCLPLSADQQPNHTASFPTLQLQCLYSVVGRLDEYSSQTLSLLPVSLRRQLLMRLPVADICRLEEDAVFMSGLDVDSIWRGLLENRILFNRLVSLRKLLHSQPTAKDCYLTEVALCLITSKRSHVRYKFPDLSRDGPKSDLVGYLLYGTRLECEDMLSLHLFTKRKSLGITWLTPLRYSREVANATPVNDMLRNFLDKFNWYPKKVNLTEEDIIDNDLKEDSDNCTLQLLMSRVETISVHNGDYRDGIFAEKSFEPILQAAVNSEPSFLNSITLSACVTNLAGLLYCMANGLRKKYYSFESDSDEQDQLDNNLVYKISGLRKIEMLGNDGGTHPHEYGYGGYPANEMESLILFLDFQVGLETLVVEGLENIVRISDPDDPRHGDYISDYNDYEAFFNYLPHFISKPSFKLLRLTKCQIPVNSVESMVSTFLGTPTDHDQSLELVDCSIVARSDEIHSKKYPLINEARTPCVCGQFKSLELCMGEPLFPHQWLFEYPKLRLKQLKLSYRIRPLNLQVLDGFQSSSIDSLTFQFNHLGYGDLEQERQEMVKFLRYNFLSEIELVRIYNRDDSMLSVMTNALSYLTSLKRIQLNDFGPYGNSKIKFQPFFDALFCMPKEQLSDFTLEIINVEDLKQEELFESWKAHGRGQKLKKLTFIVMPHIIYTECGGCSIAPQLNVSLSDMALNFSFDYVLR